MAGTGVTLYQTTAAGNKAVIGTIDWREAIYMPSQVNDNVAQIMADIRAMANAVATGWIEIGDGDGTYTATYVSATSFRFDGVNVTAYYRVGMRVRVVAPTPGTLSGTITSSTFSTHTTLVVAWDSGSLSNEAITSVSLGVGSDATATALASTPTSYRNILGRNGGMEVWQRTAGGAASIGIAASGAQYTADGWWFACGANQASSIGQAGPIATGSRWSMAVQRNSGQTGVGSMWLEYPLDGDEIALMRNSRVTLSLALQAGPQFSPASYYVTAQLITGLANPAKRYSGTYTSEGFAINTAFAISQTAARYTATSAAVIPSNITQATLLLLWTPIGTAGAADTVYIDDVQLEVGLTATPFERRPFEQELAACRRHYWKTFSYATVPVQNAGINTGEFQFPASAASGVAMFTWMPHPVLMRIAPNVVGFNPQAANVQARAPLTVNDCSGTTLLASERGVQIQTTVAAAVGMGNPLALHMTADAGI